MNATEVVLNVSGVGTISNINPDGTTVGHDVNLTGTVTINVYGVPDQVDPGVAIGYAWVSTFYQLNWTGSAAGNFNSGAVPAATMVSDGAAVFDNFNAGAPGDRTFDRIDLGSFSQRRDANLIDSKDASLIRLTTLTSWLSGLTFPTFAGLAPRDPSSSDSPTNTLAFSETHLSYDPLTDAYTYLPGSYTGLFPFSTSITVVSSVPEPGVFTLMALGLGIVGWRVRRRITILRADSDTSQATSGVPCNSQKV